MRSHFCRLTMLFAVLGLSGCSLWPFGHSDKDDGDVVAGEQVPGQVIDPNVFRRRIEPIRIDTENFEVGFYEGLVNTTSGNLGIIGLRGDWHVTEDFFLEAHYGSYQAADALRVLLGTPKNNEFEHSTYGLNVGWNVMPGEVYFGRSYAMTSIIYVLGGYGKSTFNHDGFTSYNAAVGLKLLPQDFWNVRLELRDQMWQSKGGGGGGSNDNLELTLGIGIFF